MDPRDKPEDDNTSGNDRHCPGGCGDPGGAIRKDANALYGPSYHGMQGHCVELDVSRVITRYLQVFCRFEIGIFGVVSCSLPYNSIVFIIILRYITSIDCRKWGVLTVECVASDSGGREVLGHDVLEAARRAGGCAPGPGPWQQGGQGRRQSGWTGGSKGSRDPVRAHPEERAPAKNRRSKGAGWLPYPDFHFAAVRRLRSHAPGGLPRGATGACR